MATFIETTIYESDALVNVDAIEMVRPDFKNDGETSVIRWRRPYEQTSPEGGSALNSHSLEYNEDEAQEPFDSLKAKILAACSSAKEKENLPPTPPIREKECRTEVIESVPTPACAREESPLTCKGLLVPTLDEVKSVAATLGIPAETAEDFWNTNSATGWTYKGSKIIVWHPLLKAWYRATKRAEARERAQLERIDAKMDERDARRTAHIDAKMDEREKKRERRAGGGRRKADNNVEMSDEVREEVRRDFAI